MSIFHNDFNECTCDCHKNNGLQMSHIMACCRDCEVCGKRIMTGHMEAHINNAHQTRSFSMTNATEMTEGSG